VYFIYIQMSIEPS